jgi:Diacylglycerol kinase accessory domain
VRLPPDIEGLLLLNINSYMGGVDLWASGTSLSASDAPTPSHSFRDQKLEVADRWTDSSRSCFTTDVFFLCALCACLCTYSLAYCWTKIPHAAMLRRRCIRPSHVAASHGGARRFAYNPQHNVLLMIESWDGMW